MSRLDQFFGGTGSLAPDVIENQRGVTENKNDIAELQENATDVSEYISKHPVLRVVDIPTDSSPFNCIFYKMTDGRIYYSGQAEDYNMPAIGNNENAFRQFFEVPLPYHKAKVVKFFSVMKSSFFLMSNGDLYGFGKNEHCILGIGEGSFNHPQLLASNVEEIFEPKGFGQNYQHSEIYIKKTGGIFYGAGANWHGRLGNGDFGQNYKFFTELAPMPDGGRITNLFNMATSDGGVFAVTDKNGLFACGGNGCGNLGVNEQETQCPSWKAVVGVKGDEVKEIHSRTSHDNNTTISVVMLKHDGTVWVTGDNRYYAMGLPDDSLHLRVFKKVDGLSGVEKIVSAGAPPTFFAMYPDKKRVSVWGYTSQGTGGFGISDSQITVRHFDLDYDDIFISSAANSGNLHQTCAYYTKNGEVFATGQNGYGGLGVGVTSVQKDWAKVQISEPIVKVVAYPFGGFNRTFFLTSEGRLYGCGCGCNGTLASLNSNMVVGTDFYTPIRLV